MMNQIDSTVVDSVAYGVSNVLQNNGGNIAFSGILIVFGGLILISGTIMLFNRLLMKKPIAEGEKQTSTEPEPKKVSLFKGKEIPEDHLIAISAAVELYRRLHFDQLESAVTFERGEAHSGWKTGYRYGQRHSLR